MNNKDSKKPYRNAVGWIIEIVLVITCLSLIVIQHIPTQQKEWIITQSSVTAHIGATASDVGTAYIGNGNGTVAQTSGKSYIGENNNEHITK